MNMKLNNNMKETEKERSMRIEKNELQEMGLLDNMLFFVVQLRLVTIIYLFFITEGIWTIVMALLDNIVGLSFYRIQQLICRSRCLSRKQFLDPLDFENQRIVFWHWFQFCWHTKTASNIRIWSRFASLR